MAEHIAADDMSWPAVIPNARAYLSDRIAY